MQHFNGTLEGTGNEVSRCGSKTSGIQTTAQGSAAVDVSLQHCDEDGDDIDLFFVTLRGNYWMSNNLGRKQLLTIRYNRSSGDLKIVHHVSKEAFECNTELAKQVMRGELNEVPILEKQAG